MVHKIIVNVLIKKILFLFIISVLLNNCAINKNIKDESRLFCSFSSSCDDYIYGCNLIIKTDSNNIELEEFTHSVGIGQYYGKGKWSYISKKRIIFECDSITEWDWEAHPYQPEIWNPNSYKEYIKKISDKKIIYFVKIGKRYRKTILRSDWCDCIPEKERSIIIKGLIPEQIR